MKEYKPYDITKLAREKAAAFAKPQTSDYPPIVTPNKRILKKNDALCQDKVKVKTSALDSLSIAREPIDLRALEQLADSQQSAAIGKMIVYAQRNLVDNQKTIDEIAEELENLADENGMSFLERAI
ncbi:hypothetical protein [Allobaculum sp. Allo2]|uniref:hypothetical protein n=1 Tax=Allobaculum sp. Allo2 TaxID=2853432 RepID=UPI003462CB98